MARLRAGALAAALLLLGCDAGEQAPPPARGDAADAESVAVVPPATPSPDTSDALTPDGWRGLVIGMTRAQVIAAAGDDANPGLVGGADPEQCDQFRPARAPEGMLVMIERDTLTRITVSRDAAVRTDRGFGVGDSAAAILRAYGDAARSTPHAYVDAPAAYITVWTTEPGGARPARGIVYEIGADGLVSHVHAGGRSITYVEGCS